MGLGHRKGGLHTGQVAGALRVLLPLAVITRPARPAACRPPPAARRPPPAARRPPPAARRPPPAARRPPPAARRPPPAARRPPPAARRPPPAARRPPPAARRPPPAARPECDPPGALAHTAAVHRGPDGWGIGAAWGRRLRAGCGRRPRRPREAPAPPRRPVPVAAAAQRVHEHRQRHGARPRGSGSARRAAAARPAGGVVRRGVLRAALRHQGPPPADARPPASSMERDWGPRAPPLPLRPARTCQRRTSFTHSTHDPARERQQAASGSCSRLAGPEPWRQRVAAAGCPASLPTGGGADERAPRNPCNLPPPWPAGVRCVAGAGARGAAGAQGASCLLGKNGRRRGSGRARQSCGVVGMGVAGLRSSPAVASRRQQ
jgi:hypothetical protein